MTATATPPAASRDPARDRPAEELFQLPLERIRTGANVRSGVGDVGELAASIKAWGVLQPLRVREIPDSTDYEVLYGHRRLAAAKEAGLSHVPAIVDASEQASVDRTVKQLIENLQREDLNPLDTAKAYRAILDEGVSQRELAALLGIAQPTIAGTLRLLKLPDAVQGKVAAGELSASHAKAIAALPDKEQAEVARRAVQHKLSAHQVEDEVRLAIERTKQADRERDAARAAVSKVEKKLAERELTKDTAQLVVTDAPLRQQLLEVGWTIIEPKTRSYLYGNTKDDCTAVEVRWTSHWPKDYPPELGSVCVDQAHAKAREERERKSRKRQAREFEKQRAEAAAARVEEAKARRGELEGTAALIVGNGQQLARYVLLELAFAANGDGGEWLLTELGGAERYQISAADLWQKLEALDDAAVARWTARVVAGEILELQETDLVRAAVLPTSEPSAKAKKAAK